MRFSLGGESAHPRYNRCGGGACMNSLSHLDGNKLDPVLITYNRAKELERTLDVFIAAGLTTIKMHILDNASTDNTPHIVALAQLKWPNLTYHRNAYNIGGNANILRALEVSNSEYSWIIGDDDAWLLDSLDELLTVIQDGKADVVRLGWLVAPDNRGKLLQATEIVESEKFFFASLSMISATIIRRCIITPTLPYGYMAIPDAYPQLVSILKSITRCQLLIYTMSTDLMIHTPSSSPGYYLGDLEWCSSWFRMSRFIDDNIIRRKFVGEAAGYLSRDTPGAVREFLILVKIVVKFKAWGITQWPYLLSMLAYGLGWRFRTISLLIINMITPKAMAIITTKIYYCITRQKEIDLHFDRSRI